jgi:hypothetical protein
VTNLDSKLKEIPNFDTCHTALQVTKNVMLLEKEQHNQQSYQDNFLNTLYGVSADCAMQWNELSPFMSCETLSMAYYAYFHSIMNTGLIFWRDSSHRAKICNIQKNIVSIITGYRSKDSCRNFFSESKNSTSSVTICTITSLICG